MNVEVQSTGQSIQLGASSRIDALEQMMAQNTSPAELPLHHEFFHDEDGKVKQYVRSCVLHKGDLWTTKIHKTEHPFFILSGHVAIYTEDQGMCELVGPCWGKTTPGTRRAIYAFEETTWITVHTTNTDDLELIEQRIIQPHSIPQRKAITG